MQDVWCLCMSFSRIQDCTGRHQDKLLAGIGFLAGLIHLKKDYLQLFYRFFTLASWVTSMGLSHEASLCHNTYLILQMKLQIAVIIVS